MSEGEFYKKIRNQLKPESIQSKFGYFSDINSVWAEQVVRTILDEAKYEFFTMKRNSIVDIETLKWFDKWFGK